MTSRRVLADAGERARVRRAAAERRLRELAELRESIDRHEGRPSEWGDRAVRALAEARVRATLARASAVTTWGDAMRRGVNCPALPR
jgi:hypothetical protein